MAVALVDDAFLAVGNTNASNIIDHTVTLTAGADLLVDLPAWTDASQQTLSAVSYNGVALQQHTSALLQLDATSVGRGWLSVDIWKLVAPLTGSAATYRHEFNGGQPTNFFGGYASFSGADQTTPLGAATTVTGTVGATSLSIAPATSTGDIALALMASSADALTNTGVTTGTELWEQADTAFGTNAIAATEPHASGSSTTITFSKPGGTRRSIATSVAVKPSGGNTLTYTAAGGISFSGAGALNTTAIRAGAGGLSLSGSADAARVTPRETAGGLSFGGASDASFHEAVRAVVAAGGLDFGGASDVSYSGGVLQVLDEGIFGGRVVQRSNQKNSSVVRTP